MDEKLKEKWLEIYDISCKICAFNPWERFGEKDTFIYMDKENERSIVMTFVYESAGYYGIAFYENEFEYYDASRTIHKENKKHEPLFFLQNAIIGLCSDREDVSKENYALIKELGIKMRGRGGWLSFNKYEHAFVPRPLDGDEVEFLLEMLKHLIMMVRAVYEQGLEFNVGESIVRWFDEETKLYYTHNFNFGMSKAVPFSTIKIEGTEKLKKLKKQPSTKRSYEVDMSYLPFPIRDNGRGTIPLLILAVEKESGMVAFDDIFSPEVGKLEAFVNMVDSLITDFGKPKALIISDPEVKGILFDFCEKAGIQLIEKKKLYKLEEARKMLFEAEAEYD